MAAFRMTFIYGSGLAPSWKLRLQLARMVRACARRRGGLGGRAGGPSLTAANAQFLFAGLHNSALGVYEVQKWRRANSAAVLPADAAPCRA